MKSVAFLSVLLMSQTAFGAVTADLINHLSGLEHSASSQPEVVCDDSSIKDPLTYQCVVDLCGPPDKQTPVIPTQKTIDKYLENLSLDDKYKKYEPFVEEAAKKTIEGFNKSKEKANALISREVIDRYFDGSSENEYAYFIEEFFIPNGQVKINVTNTGLNVDDQFDYSKIDSEDREKFKALRSKFISENTSGVSLISKEVIKDPAQLKELWAKAEEQYSLWYQEILKKDPTQVELLSDIKSSKYQGLSSYSKEHELIRIKSKYYEVFPEKYCDLDCRSFIKSYLYKKIKVMRALFNEMGNDLEAKKADYILKCKTFAALEADNSGEEYKKLLANLPEVYNEILTKFSPYMSAHSQKKLTAALQKLNVRNSNGVRLDREFPRMPRIAESAFKQEMDYRRLYSFSTSLINADKINLSPFNLNKTCDSAFTWTLWDNFSPGIEPLINLSNFTCLNHHHGAGKTVLFHEIGHYVDALAEGKELSDTTSTKMHQQKVCISQQQVLLTRPGSDSYNYKTTEDFADFFAYITTADTKNTRPSFCQQFSTDREQNKYAELDFKINNRDTHSNGLFRTLHEAHVKKMNIPKSCEDLLEKYSDTYEFKECR